MLGSSNARSRRHLRHRQEEEEEEETAQDDSPEEEEDGHTSEEEVRLTTLTLLFPIEMEKEGRETWLMNLPVYTVHGRRKLIQPLCCVLGAHMLIMLLDSHGQGQGLHCYTELGSLWRDTLSELDIFFFHRDSYTRNLLLVVFSTVL